MSAERSARKRISSGATFRKSSSELNGCPARSSNARE